MVYIEFYDQNAVENVCSSLSTKAERVYILGGNKKAVQKCCVRYTGLLEERGIHTEFYPVNISKNKLKSLIKSLLLIIKKEEECCIDLTGGDDLCLVAAGYIAGYVKAKYPDKVIQMHRFNIRTNAVDDCDGDGNVISTIPAPQLRVDENIRVYGADIAPGHHNNNRWKLTESDVEDIKRIWEICATDTTNWNCFVSDVEKAEKCKSDNSSKLKIFSGIQEIKRLNGGNDCFSGNAMSVIRKRLNENRLVRIEESKDRSVLKITYKSEIVRQCLIKSGNALEMLVYAMALEAEDKGKKVYNDVMHSVYVDWDGEIHPDKKSKSNKESQPDQKNEKVDCFNEIDIVAMKNLTPVFISCKNGAVNQEELYKLYTVANHLGGKYAKKVLVTASLVDSAERFRQRAKDLGITIIEEKDPKKIKKLLKNAYQS